MAFSLSQIVTGDETWCQHFELESKQWESATSPPPKKSKAVHTTVLVRQYPSFLTTHFLSTSWNGKPPSMPSVIKPLYRTLEEPSSRNAPGMLSNGVILLHDNARPHTANAVKTTLQQLRWEILEHPSYSPNISPCDFHAFGPLKRAIRGHRFTTDDDVCNWVQAWI
ncbi:mariner Mos1 transposase [Trichonephila clavipes]|nr:mariner Mos1 transposase [Trichonephila clavipes]